MNGYVMQKQQNRFPEYLKKYFWDCDFAELSFNKYPFFITERILNYGNETSVKWLLEQVDIPYIVQVVVKSRKIDKKTKNFWKIKLGEN
jgi:hypothetical protein